MIVRCVTALPKARLCLKICRKRATLFLNVLRVRFLLLNNTFLAVTKKVTYVSRSQFILSNPLTEDMVQVTLKQNLLLFV